MHNLLGCERRLPVLVPQYDISIGSEYQPFSTLSDYARLDSGGFYEIGERFKQIWRER
jgi:hypothetical protein